MTKRTLVVALAVALALIGTGCKSSSETALEPPTVTAEATGDGGVLRLSWQAVEGATSYEITAGTSVDTTTSTSFDVSTPVATIEVRSVKGSSKSDSAATTDCKTVESKVEFFGDLDLSHANGFGFNDDGSAVACTLKYPSELGMDFYADNVGGVVRLKPAVVSPTRKGDQLKAASGEYDDITMADPLGTYGDSALPIVADSTYYLRISPDTTGGTWSTEDNFAKARVDSIVGVKVSLTTAYQRIGGLRWLVK